MKLLLITLFLSISSYSQQSVEKLLDFIKVGIDIESISEKSFGFDIVYEPMHIYGIDSESNGITICEGEKKLLFLWTKHNSSKIYEIIVLDSRINIDGKIRVGVSFEKFKAIYPDAKIEIDLINENYEYAHSENCNYLVEFLRTNGVGVAEYNEDYSLKEVINVKSKIDRIRLNN